jgi:uncharacterized protein
MTYPPVMLIDSGLLVAYYSATDRHHAVVRDFLADSTSALVTTLACVTEVVWLLAQDWRVQNEFLSDLAIELYRCEPLIVSDFARITELNEQYSSLPGDFADLSLVAISERLNIAAIATLDKDFDIYRRYRKQPFDRQFRP